MKNFLCYCFHWNKKNNSRISVRISFIVQIETQRDFNYEYVLSTNNKRQS